MAELADALDSESSARLGRIGSSPIAGIIIFEKSFEDFFFLLMVIEILGISFD